MSNAEISSRNRLFAQFVAIMCMEIMTGSLSSADVDGDSGVCCWYCIIL